jgi:hypothetical protein
MRCGLDGVSMDTSVTALRTVGIDIDFAAVVPATASFTERESPVIQ